VLGSVPFFARHIECLRRGNSFHSFFSFVYSFRWNGYTVGNLDDVVCQLAIARITIFSGLFVSWNEIGPTRERKPDY